MRWGDPDLSELLLGLVLFLLTAVWLAMAAFAQQWGSRWRLRPLDAGDNSSGACVSVCIPARNEAGRIGSCVEAVLALSGGLLEVIVVDDGSEDGTAQEAMEAGGNDPRLRVIQGSPPPSGWAGKSWACQRAAGEAAGDYLLFVDADVRLAPWVLDAGMARLREKDLGLLSLFGDWELVGFWEKTVIPVVGWFIRGSVDLDAVNHRASNEAFANGQFILVSREAYDAVGGHRVVKGEVLEDVKLARAFKQRALGCGLMHAPGGFRVRLYESLEGIVEGYTKNLYEGMNRRPLVALGAACFILVGTLAPFLSLALLMGTRVFWGWHLVGWGWIGWIGLICVLIPVFRWRLERFDGRDGWYALTHPLGNLVFVWILLRSLILVETEWKGRTFFDGRAS